MNLYLTDAIGFIKPGMALVKAESEIDAVQKISKFTTAFPQYRIFRTKMVLGQESDEVDFDVRLNLVYSNATQANLPENVSDIDIIDGGGLNEDPQIGNGVHIK